jgi:hypothetical protein
MMHLALLWRRAGALFGHAAGKMDKVASKVLLVLPQLFF